MLVYLIQELARGGLQKLHVDLCHTSVLRRFTIGCSGLYQDS